ncbi:hypothetical protein TNCV_2379261 [Trichonephila clavipes]|uniref:Uncharacterized protein n=1 Tax=Trichonephila clavipes TaxID=2585209 RepID=A0A8X6RH04_TRICX|nr:hypothetical protein TNCV_2379261 [Trichonephila clavipes]
MIQYESTHSALRLESRFPQDPGHFLNDWLSFLLLASMTILWSDLHKHTGYGMEARFASHMPSYCTEGLDSALYKMFMWKFPTTLGHPHKQCPHALRI